MVVEIKKSHLKGMVDIISDDYGFHYADLETHHGLQSNNPESDDILKGLCMDIVQAVRDIDSLFNQGEKDKRSVATGDAQSHAADKQKTKSNQFSGSEPEGKEPNERAIVELFNKYYEYVFTTDDSEQRGEWKRSFAQQIIRLFSWPEGKEAVELRAEMVSKEEYDHAINEIGQLQEQLN